jgi:iron complex outermembrane receptor protein
LKQTRTRGLAPRPPRTRERLMTSTMIAGLALAAATAAHAQGAPPDPATQTNDVRAGEVRASEVVVTGTRLRAPNLTSVSPVITVGAQDFKLTGATDVVDALNQLPQTSVGGTSLNNTPNPLSGSGGFTTIDLRNLGPARTLVLEDGRRLMPGDPTLGGEAPDLDQIPMALIERVDIVTGGASAVYGSDAVAGVVNFIMKHDFQGVSVDAQYGFNQHDNGDGEMQSLVKAFGSSAPNGSIIDGRTFTTTITAGSNTPDGKGNVTAYVGYRHADPVTQSARDYSACQLQQAGVTPQCTGSSNSNVFGDALTGRAYSVAGAAPNNVFTPYSPAKPGLTPPSAFNASPYQYLERADQRYQAGFFAHYQVAPSVDLYSDFAFMDDQTRSDVAPSGLFLQNGVFAVNCNNPFLSAQQIAAVCHGPEALLEIGRRDIEGGPRVYDYEHESFKIDVGARGDFGSGWHYDVYAQYGRTNYSFTEENDLSLTKIQNALLVGGTAANPVCLTGGACVPYNIFANGGVTSAALQSLTTSGSTTGDTEEEIVSASLSGNLDRWGVKSPWATSGVSVSVGTEFRREQLDDTPDAALLSGDLAGAGGAAPPVHGSFDVKEVFGEVGVPLIGDKPFIKDLSLEGGYRFSDYSLSGDVGTYKIGVNYSPESEIRFRGSFNRAVRAPNVNELFSPLHVTNSSEVSSDPCSAQGSGGHAAASLAACQRTGVTAAQYGDGRDPAVGGTDTILQCPSGQCGTALGGNLKLTPEVSDTYSGGVVITPRFIPGLIVSVDYFNIDVDNAIAVQPINLTLGNCLTSGADCSLIVRQANGSLFGSSLATGGYITQADVNIGHIQTEGVDFAASYRLDLESLGLHDSGQLQFKFDGTWTSHLNYQPVPGQGQYNCAGLYGVSCGLPTPNWRHQLRVTWISPWSFNLSAQWRYLSGSRFDGNQANPLLNVGAFDANDASIGAYSYLDLSASWKVRPKLTLRAGVNNVLDTNPPVLDNTITSAGSPNTFNSYDLLGRQIFIGLTADF